MRRQAVAALAALVLTAPVAAAADGVAEFYSGKTITIISGGSPGGGFSNVARVLGIFLEKHIPGHPSVIIGARPGGGGAVMMAYMANAAPQDGTVLGAALPLAVNAPLLRKVKYDPSKFQWLGSVTPMTEVSTVWHTAPATTLDGAKNVELVMATSNKLSSAYLIPAFLNSAIGTKFKIIQGYRGGGPMNKAMLSGEVHGRGSFYNSYRTTTPDWVKNKSIVHLLQVGPTVPELKDVPNLRDIVTDPDQIRMVDFMEAPAYVGHGFFAPPDVPSDRVAALREAFWTTVNSAEFHAEAKKRSIDVDPIRAEKVQAVIGRAMATSPEILAKFRKMVDLPEPK